MKILMATMGLDIGGAETHIVELAKELKARGHEVVIASNGGVYVAEVEEAGIRHYAVPMHRRSVGDMLRSRTLLRRILREERPDIVHAHARIPAFLCGTLQRELGFPFVTSCHGVFQVSGILKLLSNWGQRTLAVSEDIRDYLIQEYGVPAGHITLTINGIDTEKFSPEVSGRAVREEFCLGDDPVIGHVSRLDQASSLAARQLIELAPRLDRAAPGVRILITGGGDVFEELDRQAQEVNLKLGRPCVVLTGPRTDINAIAAACDLFVGVSRSALEAMAAEKPVVLSGAQGHTGLFRPELLEKAIDTNFCCRTDPVATEAVLLEAVTSALALPEEEKRELETLFTSFGKLQLVEERLEVSQGKLALGFRTGGITCWEEEYPALVLCNAIFGGTPLSKLFLNVREKLSLCYYASSVLEKMKGLVLVSSGIEFDKYQQAKDEILAQLEAIRRGEIEDWELEGARRTLISGHLSTLDDQGRLEEFWLGQAAAGLDTGVEELAGRLASVTREQVAAAARRLELDTVYFLKGQED